MLGGGICALANLILMVTIYVWMTICVICVFVKTYVLLQKGYTCFFWLCWFGGCNSMRKHIFFWFVDAFQKSFRSSCARKKKYIFGLHKGKKGKKKMLGPSLVIFVLLTIFIIFGKPSFLIDNETGEWKQFGFGPGKSCLNVTAIIVFCAIFSYLISACLKTTFSNFKVQRGGGPIPPTIVASANLASAAPPPVVVLIPPTPPVEFPAFDLQF